MPGIVIQITGDGAGAAEALRIIEQRMSETAERGKAMSESLAKAGEMVRGAFEMMGVALGIREVITQMKEAVTAAAEFGEAISKAAQRTGIAAGTLSVLHYTADVTGTDFEKLVSGVSRMSKNMADAADGNKKMAAAFQAAHINAADLVGRTDGVEVAFRKLGATLVATEAPARRNQLVMDILGKAGSAAIPAITDLALHFDELKAKTIDAGRYLDALAAERLKELAESLKDMKERIAGAQLAFAEGLQPALEGVFTAFGHATNGSNIFTEAGKQVGLAVIPLAGLFLEMATFIREAADEYRNLAAAMTAVDTWAGEHTNWTATQRQQAAERHQAALKEMAESKADHQAAEDEEKRFLNSLKELKQQIESGKTGTFRTTPLGGEGGAGGEGFGGIGKGGDGVPWWVTNIHNRLEIIKNLLKDDIALAKQLNAEAGREQWEKETNPGVGGANLTGIFGPTQMPEAHLMRQWDDMPSAPHEDRDDSARMEEARMATNTIGGFMGQISEMALKGKLDFKSLVDSAISDLMRFALKMEEEKWILPMMESMFGVGTGDVQFNSAGYATMSNGQTFAGLMAGGGDLGSDDYAIVGEKGPELFAPGTPGSVIPNDVVKGMAQAGGGSRGAAPSVVINNVNNSSQNVNMKQGGVSYDSEAKQFIIHTILEDAASGGPVSAAFGAGRG